MDIKLSKYSNSEIGSHHWAATLLSFGMRVGEYLEQHEDGVTKPAERQHYSQWGTELKERLVEVNNYLQSLPDKKQDDIITVTVTREAAELLASKGYCVEILDSTKL